MFGIEELKKRGVVNAATMAEYAKSLKKDGPTVILKNYRKPVTPPYLEAGVKRFDAAKQPRPLTDIKSTYGTRTNVAGGDMVNAVIAALGGGSYAFHVSDGSYTGYSIWELQEYLYNFDSTNLRVWVEEIFDCDDFAQVLQGNVNGFFPGIAFGTLWYGDKSWTWGHAVNIFYDYFGNKVWLVEPQNDALYEFDKENWVPWVVMI